MAKIILKKSNVTNKVPVVGDLDYGELALNYTDGKLWYKNNSDVITQLNAGLTGTVPVNQGGTGLTTYTTGDLLYASAATTLSKLADVAAGNALISGGVSTAPTWGKIGLTTHISGTLPVANGGTGLTSYTANGIIYASGTGTLASGSSLTFDGTTLGVNSINSINISRGGGAITTNTAIGSFALNANITGSNNTALGYASLLSVTTGSNNTALGSNALGSILTGSFNTAVGKDALYNNGKVTTAGSFIVGASYTIQTTGTTNFTLIGAANSTPGTVFFATGVGTGTGTASGNAGNNTAVGHNALFSNLTGDTNTAIGLFSLKSNTKGASNTGLGANTLSNNTTGYSNTAQGSSALASNITGYSNTATGTQALNQNQTGTGNTAVGFNALFLNGQVTSAGSFVIGVAYTIQTTGTTNFTLIGAADSNPGTVFVATGVGAGTGTASSNTENNTAIGFSSGSGVTTGKNNTIIGTYSGAAAPISATGSNYIVLSDGLSNVRLYSDPSGNINIPSLTASKAVFTNASKNLTSTGTLGVDQGGTGITTLTGIVKGNGTSAFTAATAGTDYVSPSVATNFTAPQRPSISAETAPTTNALTWDLTVNSIMRINLNANITTLTLTGTLSTYAGYQYQAIVRYNGGTTITWPATVKFAGGTAPTLTGTSGKVDIFNFIVASNDGGTTFFLLCTGNSQNL